MSARMVTVGVFLAAEISTFPPVSSSGSVLCKWVFFGFEEWWTAGVWSAGDVRDVS